MQAIWCGLDYVFIQIWLHIGKDIYIKLRVRVVHLA